MKKHTSVFTVETTYELLDETKRNIERLVLAELYHTSLDAKVNFYNSTDVTRIAKVGYDPELETK
jgi:hypothetical protein